MGKKSRQDAGKKANDDDDEAALEEALKEAGEERKKAALFIEAGDEIATRGDLQKALENYSKAIAVDPHEGLHYCKRSAVLLAAGRRPEAIAEAQHGASLGSKSALETAECWCQLGYALMVDGQLQAAYDAYDKALKTDETHYGACQGREDLAIAIERANGTKPKPVRGPRDVEAQDLLTLPAPAEVLGKGFEVVHLKVGSSEQILNFLLSTSLPVEATISPAGCARAGVKISRTVDLENVRFSGGAVIGTFKDCPVGSFMQATIAERSLGARLDGVLGLPFLQRFDIELDRPRGFQFFKQPGAAKNCEGLGMFTQPTILLPSNLIGLAVQVRCLDSHTHNAPILGVIDTSLMFSIINWSAAKDIGLISGPEDPKLKDATKVAAQAKAGVEEMPLFNVRVALCVTPENGELGWRASSNGGGWQLDLKGSDRIFYEPGRINAAVGDAAQLELLRDSKVGEFAGPAILLGQDIMAQMRRLKLSVTDRKIWLEPPAKRFDAGPI